MVKIAPESQRGEALRAFETAIERCWSVVSCHLMSGSDDYHVTVVARDLEDYEQIHKSQLSWLPHVSRIQSSFALREVLERPGVLQLLTPPPRRKR